jgi:molybdopterin-guanine dinucleotide biosynthesis protein A
MPFVDQPTLLALLKPEGAAVVATTDRRLQPLLALYRPTALAALAAAEPNAPLTKTVEALEPATVAVPETIALSINTPEDLHAAEARLSA